MDEKEKDPFDMLFDDSLVEDQKQLIAETIFPYVRFTSRDVFEIMFTDDGEDLTVREKLLVFLLAWKVFVIREMTTDEEATPKEMEEKTGIPGGSIRPTLKKLVDEKVIQSNNTGYFIPNARIKRISQILGGKS